MDNQELILNNYGVTLKRLTHEKIELVRSWRNDPKIQQTMFYQVYITSEMQEKWFLNLDKEKNFYFIIECNSEEIGLINIKNIDLTEKTGETGVFIYEDKYLNTDIAYRAHLVMFDYIFNTLNLSSTYSHIRNDNNRAIRFSQFLGGVNDDTESNESSVKHIILKDNYLSNKNRIRFINKWKKINNKL